MFLEQARKHVVGIRTFGRNRGVRQTFFPGQEGEQRICCGRIEEEPMHVGTKDKAVSVYPAVTGECLAIETWFRHPHVDLVAGHLTHG